MGVTPLPASTVSLEVKEYTTAGDYSSDVCVYAKNKSVATFDFLEPKQGVGGLVLSWIKNSIVDFCLMALNPVG